MMRIHKPYIESLGIYEPGKPIEEVAREIGFQDVAELIKLASNENLFGPSAKAIESIQKHASKMHLYPDGGAYYLRKALATHYGVNPDQLLFGNGSNELIEFLGHVFLEKNTSIVVSEHAFVMYRLIAALFEAETITVPEKNFTHDLSAMADAIREDTRMVFIANPNNPTGTAVAPSDFAAFMDRVPEQVLVVLDEAYFELLPEKQKLKGIEFINKGKNIILLRTFSKAYGLAGLRIGYAIAAPTLIRWLEKFRQPFNVNAMAQHAALAALDDQEHVEMYRKEMQEGVAFFAQAFDKLGIPFVPSFTNFILVKVGKGGEIFKKLQEEGVIVRPMAPYGLGEYVRITVGTTAQNEKALKALTKVMQGAP